MTGNHEESHLECVRRLIEEQYQDTPTGCGSSFGEILCWEIHVNGLTFIWLAEKWGMSLPLLGELIWDHCKRLEPRVEVNHHYSKNIDDIMPSLEELDKMAENFNDSPEYQEWLNDTSWDDYEA